MFEAKNKIPDKSPKGTLNSGGDGAEDFVQIDVPTDGSCLFWSVAFAYLIPSSENYDEFHEKCKLLFGKESSKDGEDLRKLILSHDFRKNLCTLKNIGYDKSKFESFIKKIREKVADYISSDTALRGAVNIDNIFYLFENNEIENNENQRELVRQKFECSLNIIPKSESIEGRENKIKSELDKKGNTINDFVSQVYLKCVRDCKFWGSETEIEAMSKMLKVCISISKDGNPPLFYSKSFNTKIRLYHINSGTHYNFGLEKSIISKYESSKKVRSTHQQRSPLVNTTNLLPIVPPVTSETTTSSLKRKLYTNGSDKVASESQGSNALEENPTSVQSSPDQSSQNGKKRRKLSLSKENLNLDVIPGKQRCNKKRKQDSDKDNKEEKKPRTGENVGSSAQQSYSSSEEAGERLERFVKDFVVIYESYFSECYKRLVEREPKSSKCANLINEMIEIGKGGTEAISVANAKAFTMVGISLIQKVVSIVGNKYNRDQLKKLTTKLYELNDHPDKVRKILVEAGTDIFYGFKSQFMQVVALKDKSWQRAMTKLAHDAVSRVVDYYRKNVKEEFSASLITKGVVLGKSKRYKNPTTGITQLHRGHSLCMGDFVLTTEEFFEELCLVITSSDTYYKKSPMEYGFRPLFDWEDSDKVIEDKTLTFKSDDRKYTQLKQPSSNKHECFLTKEELEVKQEEILGKLDNQNQNLTEELEDILKQVRQDADKNAQKLLKCLKKNYDDIKQGLDELKQTVDKIDGATERIESVVNEIKNAQNSQLAIPILSRLAKLNVLEIDEVGIKFQTGKIQELKDLIEKGQVIDIVADKDATLLTRVKVNEVSASLSYSFKFTMKLSHVFNLKSKLIGALKEEKNSVLVIDCIGSKSISENDVERLRGLLSEIMEHCQKVVLITEQNIPVGLINQGCREYKDKIRFNDLTLESKKKILEKEIAFQGSKVPLNKLIGENFKDLGKIVNARILSDLIDGKDIIVDEALTNLGMIGGYYINRKFNYQTRVKEEFLKEQDDKFVIICAEDELGDLENKIGNKNQTTRSVDVKNFSKKQKENCRFFLVAGVKDTDFEDLCKNYHAISVHLLKKENNEFIWQKSQGTSLSGLRKYIDKSVPGSSVSEDGIISNKFAIIAAEPGAGKSTVLSHLAKEIKEESLKKGLIPWIMRISLSERILSKVGNKKPVESLLAVKESVSGKACTQLEKELFKYKFSRGEVVLLFDGFDEIGCTYEKEIIKLLQNIKKEDVKVEGLLVATRTYKQSELEDSLGVLSYTLELLSQEEQEEFLERFWKTNLVCSMIRELVTRIEKTSELEEVKKLSGKIVCIIKSGIIEDSNLGEIEGLNGNYNKEQLVKDVVCLVGERRALPEKVKDEVEKIVRDDDFLREFKDSITKRAKDYAKKLIKELSGSIFKKEREFAGIPLQIRMLAEAFQENFEKGNPPLIGKLNLLKLYEKFIESKYNIYFRKYLTKNLERDKSKPIRESAIENINAEHGFRALEMLSLKESNGKEFRGKKTYFEKMIQDVGIVEGIVNDHPSFVHRTFAEYFVANFFVGMLEKPVEERKLVLSFLNKNIFKKEFGVVRNFFDRMLAEENEIHIATLNDNKEKVKALLKSNNSIITETDKEGRTAIHLAATYGHLDILKFLLDYGASVLIKDKIFDWSPLSYADKCNYLDVADLLLQRGANGSDMFEAIKNVHTLYEENRTLLHIAASEGYLNFAEVLVGAEANVLAQDKNGDIPLHLAAQYGHNEIVKLLVEKEADSVDNRNKDGDTSLHLAAWSKNNKGLDVVKYLVDKVGDIDARNKNGDTALVLATKQSNNEVVKFLVGKGADISAKSDGMTLLECAKSVEIKRFLRGTQDEYNHSLLDHAYQGEFCKVKNYLKKGANVNAQDKKGLTLLYYAASYCRKELTKDLLNAGAEINIKDKDKKTPLECTNNECITAILTETGNLFECVESNRVNEILGCIGRGAVVNAKKDGMTPLHLAARKDSKEIVRALLEAGAEINIKDKDKKTPLECTNNGCITAILTETGNLFECVESNRVNEILGCIGRGAVVNAKKDGMTPLHLAARKDSKEIVRALLEAGAEINIKDKDKKTPLECTNNGCITAILTETGNLFECVESNRVNEILGCIGRGAVVNAKKDGMTPLHLAARKDSKEIVRALLEAGAEINIKDKDKKTPLECTNNGCITAILTETGNLFECVESNRVNEILGCIGRGAVVNAKKDGMTPLHLAASKGKKKEGRKEAVNVLLNGGANVNTTDNQGRAALHLAARKSSEEIVRALLDKGAEVNARDNCCWTALHYAIDGGVVGVAKLLIKTGAIVDATSDEGRTPLHLAASKDSKEIVRALLEAGADISATDNGNFIPLSYASKEKKSATVILTKTGNLFECVESNRVNEILGCIGKGAVVNAKKRGKTPLHVAVENGNVEVVNTLLEFGADINVKDNEGFTPLSRAVEIKNDDIAKILICKVVKDLKEGGVSLERINRNSRLKVEEKGSEINVASYEKGVVEYLEELASKREQEVNVGGSNNSVNVQKEQKGNTEHDSATRGGSNKGGSSDSLQFQDSKLAELSDMDNGSSSYSSNREVINSARKVSQVSDESKQESLKGPGLSNSSEQDVKMASEESSSDESSCHSSSSKNSAEQENDSKHDNISKKSADDIQREQENDAENGNSDDSNPPSSEEQYKNDDAPLSPTDFQEECIPLHYVACKGNVKRVEDLLKAGADINIKGDEGFTALHHAAINNKVDIVNILLKAGADINVKDDEGFTALSSVVEMENDDIAKILICKAVQDLIKGGVSIDEINGSCYLEVAEEDGKINIVHYKQGVAQYLGNLKPRLVNQNDHDLLEQENDSKQSDVCGEGSSNNQNKYDLLEKGVQQRSSAEGRNSSTQNSANLCHPLKHGSSDSRLGSSSFQEGKLSPLDSIGRKSSGDENDGDSPSGRGSANKIVNSLDGQAVNVIINITTIEGDHNYCSRKELSNEFQRPQDFSQESDLSGSQFTKSGSNDGDPIFDKSVADGNACRAKASEDVDIGRLANSSKKTPELSEEKLALSNSSEQNIESGGSSPQKPVIVADSGMGLDESQEQQGSIQKRSLEESDSAGNVERNDAKQEFEDNLLRNGSNSQEGEKSTSKNVGSKALDYIRYCKFLQQTFQQPRGGNAKGSSTSFSRSSSSEEGTSGESAYIGLFAAAKDNNSDLIGELIDSGADVNEIERCGYTPLHIAAQFDSVGAAQDLIKKGANIKFQAQDDRRSTPFEFACRHNASSVVKLLIEHHNDEEKKKAFQEVHKPYNFTGNLHKKYYEILAIFKNHGIECGTNISGFKSSSCFQDIDSEGYLVPLGKFQSCRNVESCNKSEFYDDKSESRSSESAELSGMDDGNSPRCSSDEGVDDDSSDSSIGELPKRKVVQFNSPEQSVKMVGKMEYASSNTGDLRSRFLEVKDADGVTPFHYAALGNAIDVVKYFMSRDDLRSRFLEVKDADGVTPFHYAALGNAIDVVKYFMSRDDLRSRFLEVKDADGVTPLVYAIITCKSEVVKLLVENGANVNAINKENSTPLDLARRREDHELIEFLKERNARLCRDHPEILEMRPESTLNDVVLPNQLRKRSSSF